MLAFIEPQQNKELDGAYWYLCVCANKTKCYPLYTNRSEQRCVIQLPCGFTALFLLKRI